MFIGTFADKISLEYIAHTENAITMRNKVVHEGWEPTSQEDVKTALRALLKLTMFLLPKKVFKFPRAKLGNRIMPVEDWGKEP